MYLNNQLIEIRPYLNIENTNFRFYNKEFDKIEFVKNRYRKLKINVILPIQNIWRSNDYISVMRLVNAWFLYRADGRAVYIYILGG